MPNVGDVARGVLAAVASDAGYLLASQWVADRYTQLLARTQFRSLRTFGEVNVPAPITAGTVTMTRDSSLVTGDATAKAAWSNAVAGQSIRGSVAWYEIEGLRPDGNLQLKSTFSETTVTAGAYTIVQRFTPLDARARWVGSQMVSMRRRLPLFRVTREELDVMVPERSQASGNAASEVWAEAGDRLDKNGKLCKAIEFYPYGSLSEIYHYVYWPIPITLGLSDDLPPELDPHVLREGALCDAMRYEMAKAARAGNIQGGALWRNEYRAQETKWERVMLDAFKADDSTNDLTFICQRAGYTMVTRDIKTALDQVLSRWPL